MDGRKVVLFIDAENVPYTSAAAIVEQAQRHGILVQRRVYGDFSRVPLKGWLDAVPRHALTSCQTVSGATGKNGADIALVIDAMDMLHASEADVFCLATSDGDFTQLAMRIRQSGRTVVGIGRSNASARFKSACDTFKIVDAPKAKDICAPSTPVKASAKIAPATVQRALKNDLLQRAFVIAPAMDGPWVGLPDLMKALKVCQSDFDLKPYGHNQFHKLLAFSGVELTDKNRKARLKSPQLKKVVDNG